MKIDIINRQKRIVVNNPVLRKIKKAAVLTLKTEKIRMIRQLTICFVSDHEIRRINRKYLKKDNPTDVIAFAMRQDAGNDEISADIVISTDTASANAKVYKTTPVQELLLYIIHGVLHVCGYDDRTVKTGKLMRQKQEAIMRALGLYEIQKK